MKFLIPNFSSEPPKTYNCYPALPSSFQEVTHTLTSCSSTWEVHPVPGPPCLSSTADRSSGLASAPQPGLCLSVPFGLGLPAVHTTVRGSFHLQVGSLTSSDASLLPQEPHPSVACVAPLAPLHLPSHDALPSSFWPRHGLSCFWICQSCSNSVPVFLVLNLERSSPHPTPKYFIAHSLCSGLSLNVLFRVSSEHPKTASSITQGVSLCADTSVITSLVV